MPLVSLFILGNDIRNAGCMIKKYIISNHADSLTRPFLLLILGEHH